MSFNPLMTLLVRALVDVLKEHPTVIELGNQTFNASEPALDAVIQRSSSSPQIDVKELNRLKQVVGSTKKESAASYYRALGFSKYDAIDINERYGSLVMDLNQDLGKSYGFVKQYDLVTNNGTGEHIFDQASVLRNMHNLTSENGIMIHIMPMINYVNHGFYCYQPSLYYSLSRANKYRMLCLGFAHRRGSGAIADLDGMSDTIPTFLLEERRMALAEILGKAKFDSKGRHPVLKKWRHRLLGAKNPGNTLGNVIDELAIRFKNVLVVAVMRKAADQPFQPPIQTLYADDFSNADMQSTYALGTPAIKGAR